VAHIIYDIIIHLLQAFSNVIFAQLCSTWQDVNWRGASRGTSSIADLQLPFLPWWFSCSKFSWYKIISRWYYNYCIISYRIVCHRDKCFLAIPTVEIANSVNVVLIETEVRLVAAVEGRHDGGLYVGMSQTKGVTYLVHRYLQQICTYTQITRSIQSTCIDNAFKYPKYRRYTKLEALLTFIYYWPAYT